MADIQSHKMADMPTMSLICEKWKWSYVAHELVRSVWRHWLAL